MADERDKRNEGDEEGEGGKPKIRIVDRRMLSDDERAGKGTSTTTAQATTAQASVAPTEAQSAPPKLEIIGGGARTQGREPNQVPDAPPEVGEPEDEPLLEPEPSPPMVDPEDDAPPMSAEEMQQVRAEMEAVEAEQFAALEERMGRPLTEPEKESVRREMERQAQSMTNLEVAPMLQQLMAEMSARAAVHMGLMPNPYTRLIAKNDAQARLAIDAFSALYEVLKPHLDATSQREYARVLNDLRVNFVSATGGAASGSKPGSPITGGPRIIH